MKNPLHPLLICFKSRKTKSSANQWASALPEDLCRGFSLAEIKAATNNFHQDFKIGESDIDKVYKGSIDDGASVVAFTRLNQAPSESAVHCFQVEVRLLCQIRHPNLVSFLGFCDDKREIILVCEHMSNGTLHDRLHNTQLDPLTWKQRLNICVGAARGLHYLHAGARFAVLHRDVKSANILLDYKWAAKLSDFGLAKIGFAKENDSELSLSIDSLGYLAPEYIKTSRFIAKSDVYSFGVVLFEVLCGRPVFDPRLEEEQRLLVPWACKCLENGTIYRVIDPYLKGKIAPGCFKKFMEIACSCIHLEGSDRPAMGEVEMGLELALELQEKSDSVQCGTTYEEVSFSASVSSLFTGLIGQAILSRYRVEDKHIP